MPGWKQWTRERLASSEFQDLIQNQVVPRFASASARTAEYPAPGKNALSMLDDWPGVVWYYTDTTWLPINPGRVHGKIWRTAGFMSALTANTDTVVGMNASRVSGGFYTQPDTLVVPFDGLYDLEWQGYTSGGGTSITAFNLTRMRAAVADVGIGSAQVQRTSSVIDATGQGVAKSIPLKVGDGLVLIANNQQNNPLVYGNNEQQGCHIAARYIGPLDGAIPL